jgi:hypothetical protein
MFQIAKQARGERGSFVKLVHLDSDDFAVIVRYPSDSKLHHAYIGPDSSEAERVFDKEVAQVTTGDKLQ